MDVDPAENQRLQNLLAAVATGLSDAIESAATEVAGLDRVATTALVALLDFSPEGSVRKLALGVGLTHSGTVRLVDRLTEAGLVRRATGSDQRSITIALTGRGKRLAQRIRAARAAQAEHAVATLTTRQRRELARTCELVLANLTAERLEQRARGESPAGGALCRMCDFAACGRPEGRCPTAEAAAGPAGAAG